MQSDGSLVCLAHRFSRVETTRNEAKHSTNLDCWTHAVLFVTHALSYSEKANGTNRGSFRTPPTLTSNRIELDFDETGRKRLQRAESEKLNFAKKVRSLRSLCHCHGPRSRYSRLWVVILVAPFHMHASLRLETASIAQLCHCEPLSLKKKYAAPNLRSRTPEE